MRNLRFFAIWLAALAVSFAAILCASGGQIVAPRPEYQQVVELKSAPLSAFESGKEKERTAISPSGSFYVEGLVDPEVRGSRALRSHSIRANSWAVGELQAEQGLLREHRFEAPVLEIYALRYDEHKRAIADWLQTRVSALEGTAKLRNTNIAELDPEVPIELRDAVVEMDEEGDGTFESILTASDLACRIETNPEQSSATNPLPLREMIAVGRPDRPVSCVFGADLETIAERWEWRPNDERTTVQEFRFGNELLARLHNSRERALSTQSKTTVLHSPNGGLLTLYEPFLDELDQSWRNARFDMPAQFSVDQTQLQTDQLPRASSIHGREAWFQFLISPQEGADNERTQPGHETDGERKKDGRARFVSARVEHDLVSTGDFGEIRARAATFDFMQDEANRIRLAECEGPIVFTPPKDADWVQKLFGQQGKNSIEGQLELRCEEGATIQRPLDLEADRDGYEIDLRGNVVLAMAGGPEILRAGRWLRMRVEEAPAHLRQASIENSEEPASKLEVRWLEADDQIVLDHKGNVGRGGHLRVDFEGWGDQAVRNLVLTDAPRIRIPLEADRPPLDLSCAGPMRLRLGENGLESAQLSQEVRVQPIEEDPEQLHLSCDELTIAGTTRESVEIHARGNVCYDEGDRHIECARLDRTPALGISILGTPARVSMQHEGEAFALRALWIGYDETRGSFCALGLAQRVELEPPASLARIDFSGVATESSEEAEARPESNEPLFIKAHFFAADLTPERTHVLGLGRVAVDGKIGARADWLWASKERQSELQLGALAGRRVQIRNDGVDGQVQGSARGLLWSEKKQGLRLIGTPHVRWRGAVSGSFDILPSAMPASGEPQTYDLRARDSIFLTQRIVQMRGRAKVRQVSARPFELGAEQLTLQREANTGKPLALDLLNEAYVIVPGETKTATNMLEVHAPRINCNVKKQELKVYGDRRSGKKAVFAMQSKPDEVWFVHIDLARFIAYDVTRT